MTDKELAKKVFHTMYDNDPFSIRMGMECLEIDKGTCILKMSVREEMLNGFAIAHGGITYSLADSALAFASNSHGIKSVSIETSISHTAPVKEGDILIASASEVSITNKIGIYQVVVINQENKTVALFKGTVFRTGKNWIPAE